MFRRYLVRRSLHALLLLVGVSMLSFLLLSIAPGDFFDQSRLNPRISTQTLEALRLRYGLTQPLPVRYFYWLISAAKGEFGISFAYGLPVWRLMAPRVLNTLLLTSISLGLSWFIAVGAGIWGAARRGGWIDRATSAANAGLLAIPEIVLASILLLFAAATGFFPAGGMRASGHTASGVVDMLIHLVLPASVLVLSAVPLLARHVKSAVLSTVEAPFVQAARSCGIRGRMLWTGQILPAAANPLISLFGLSAAGLLSSSLIVEVIFAWPGLGPLLLEAIEARDVYLILGSVMLSTVLLAGATLLADVALFWCDPRIRVK